MGKHTLVYGTGVVLGKIASFIMLPVYTHYLTTADYGVLELLGTTIDVIGMIAGVGLAGAVFKFYSEFADPEEKRQVISTTQIGSTILALLTTLAGIAFAGPLTRLVFRGDGNPDYFRIFFLIYFFQAAGGTGLLLLRIQERSVLFVAFNFAKLILSLGFNIWFVVVRKMGLEGVMLSSIIVAALSALVMMAYTFRHVGLRFSFAKMRRMSQFGAPLVAVSVGSFILTFADRYFLNYYRGTGDVGVYSLAYKFTFVLSTLMLVPFQQIWEPRRYEIARGPDAQEIFGRMFFYSNLLLVGGAALMVATIHDVLRILVAPAYVAAYAVVPVILIATILQQWATYCNIGLFLRERTNLLAWASVYAVVCNVVLNVLLIPRWGMMGAAWATVGAYVVRFAFVYAFSQAQYHITYPWLRSAGLVAVFLAAYVVRALVADLPLSNSLPVSAGLVLLVLAVCVALLTPDERASLLDLARRLKPARTLRTA